MISSFRGGTGCATVIAASRGSMTAPGIATGSPVTVAASSLKARLAG